MTAERTSYEIDTVIEMFETLNVLSTHSHVEMALNFPL
jgi:hypothetical protein